MMLFVKVESMALKLYRAPIWFIDAPEKLGGEYRYHTEMREFEAVHSAKMT